MNSILHISNKIKHRSQIEEVSDSQNLNPTITDTITEFIIKMEEQDFHTVMIDYTLESEYLRLVKITKKLRPRMPFILFVEYDDKQFLQNIYNEGVFCIYLPCDNKQFPSTQGNKFINSF